MNIESILINTFIISLSIAFVIKYTIVSHYSKRNPSNPIYYEIVDQLGKARLFNGDLKIGDFRITVCSEFDNTIGLFMQNNDVLWIKNCNTDPFIKTIKRLQDERNKEIFETISGTISA